MHVNLGIFILFILKNIYSQCLRDFGSQTCLFCYYSFYNPGFPVPVTNESNCSLKNKSFQTSIYQRKVLIYNRFDLSKENISEFNAVYNDVFIAMLNENTLLSTFFESQLIMVFTNETHSLFSSSPEFEYFRRVTVNLTIKPLLCNETIYLQRFCKSDFDKVTLLLRSNFLLYISFSLSIIDLNFDGSDLILPFIPNTINNSTLTQCRKNDSICCQNSFHNNTYSEESNEIFILCGMIGKNQTVSQNFIGIINLEIIYDVSVDKIVIPVLNIQNCNFVNFFLTGSIGTSLIQIRNLAAQILIFNCLFKNFFPASGIANIIDSSFDYYTSTNWEINFLNTTLQQNFVNQSYFYIINLVFENDLPNYQNSNSSLILIDLRNWESLFIAMNVTFNDLENFVLFSFKDNIHVFQLQDLNVINSKIQIISSSGNSFQLSNLIIKNSEIFYSPFFGIANSICYIRNITMVNVSNKFSLLFSFESSLTNIDQLNMSKINGLLAVFYNSKVSINNFSCISSFSPSDSFSFYQTNVTLQNLHFENIFASNAIFAYLYCNASLIQIGYFSNITADSFFKPLTVNYFVLQDCVFSKNIVISNIIKQNSALLSASFLNNVFSDLRINSFIMNIGSLIFCNFENNYLFNISYGSSRFAFEIFQGTWIMKNNIFEKHFYTEITVLLFDIEISENLLINNSFLFLNTVSKWKNCVIKFWEAISTILDHNNFVFEKFGFPTYYIFVEDGGPFINTNGNFILVNKNFLDSNSAAIAICVLGSPLVLLQGNYFANIESRNFQNIFYIVGIVTIQGVSSFSQVSNNYKLQMTSNTFVNCSSIYGGSIGILDYNYSVLQNIVAINSHAFEGGFMTTYNCIFLLMINIISFNSTASKGSFLYAFNSDFIKLNESNINICLSLQSGSIEARTIQILKIEDSFFGNLSSSFGSFLSLYASKAYITNVSLSFGQAFGNGGNIYLNQISSINLMNITSNNSQSGQNGGFLYVEDSDNVNMTNVIIENSRSYYSGGGVYINNVNILDLKNVTFISSIAKHNGILFMMSLQASFRNNISNVIFFNCRANLGSAIFYSFPSDLNITNIKCFQNKGSLFQLNYVYSINVFLKNGEMSDNTGASFLFQIQMINFYMFDISMKNNSVKEGIMLLEQANVLLQNISLINPINFKEITEQNTDLYFLKAKGSSLSCKHIFFKGFDEMVPFLDILSFMSFTNSYISLEECLFKNNIYAKTGLILLENSNSKILSCLFLNNTGPSIKLVNSHLTTNFTHFENLGNENSFNDLYIEESESDINLLTKIKLFNVLIHIVEGISSFFQNIDSIEIQKSTFIGFSNKMSQGLEFHICQNVKVADSLFLLTYAEKGSAIFFSQEKEKLELFVQNCQFIFCQSNQGGAMFISNPSDVQLISNSFILNRALKMGDLIGFGGAIAFNSHKCLNCSTFFIENNTFINNSATIAPTIYSFRFIQKKENIFLNNNDDYNMTQDVLCGPFHLNILEFNSGVLHLQNPFVFQNSLNISSGEPIFLIFEILDGYNRRLVFDNSSTSFVKPTLNTTLKKIENDFSISNQGLFNLTQLSFYAEPQSSFEVILGVNYIDLFKDQYVFIEILTLQTRKCVQGEVFSPNYYCNYCPENYYITEDSMFNFDLDKLKVCHSCPKNAFCPGGSLVIPNSGFWRISPSTLKFIACENNDYCIGMPSNMSSLDLIQNFMTYENNTEILMGVCLYGHENNLCQECVYGFGKYFSGGTCVVCKDYDALVIVRLIIAFIILIVYLMFTSQQILKNDRSSLFDEVSKVYINHFQKMSLIMLVDFSSLIAALKNFLNFLNSLSFLTDDIFSNDCFVQHIISKNNADKIYFFKVFINLILPLILAFSCLILIFTRSLYLRYYKSGKNKSSNILHKFAILFFITIFIYYPLLTKMSLSLLNCVSLDESNKTYMYASPNLQCWDSIHFIYFFGFGMTGILIFGVGFPTVLFITIHNHFKVMSKSNLKSSSFIICDDKTLKDIKPNKQLNFSGPNLSNDDLQSTDVFKQQNLILRKNSEEFDSFRIYHFFYKDYKTNHYYWETTIFFQKFLLTLLQNLNQLIMPELRDFAFILILFVYLLMVIKLRPFKREFINRLEINSVVTALLTKYCLMLAFSNYFNSTQKMMFMVLQLLLNIIFIIHVLYIIIRYTNWRGIIKEGMIKFKMIATKIKKTSIKFKKAKTIN